MAKHSDSRRKRSGAPGPEQSPTRRVPLGDRLAQVARVCRRHQRWPWSPSYARCSWSCCRERHAWRCMLDTPQ